MNSITNQIVAVITVFLLAACANNVSRDPRLAGPSATDLSRMASAPSIRRIVARQETDVDRTARSAEVVAAEGVNDARGLRFLQVSAIPYLRRSPEGAAFLRQSYPRALARGIPAARCPAAAASPADSATVGAAASAALGACFAQLSGRSAPSSCGCELMAIDGVLLAPRREFTFAPGVAGLLIRDSGGETTRFVAESEPSDVGGESILMRDASGLVGVLQTLGDEAVMRLADDAETIWQGDRAPFGYRRGRLAERITLTSDGGQTVRLLIGVERRDAAATR